MENLSKEQGFNEEPVYYCASCLSLAIREVNGEGFCDPCGCTEIKSATIEEWEKLYEEKYGHKYIQ